MKPPADRAKTSRTGVHVAVIAVLLLVSTGISASSGDRFHYYKVKCLCEYQYQVGRLIGSRVESRRIDQPMGDSFWSEKHFLTLKFKDGHKEEFDSWCVEYQKPRRERSRR